MQVIVLKSDQLYPKANEQKIQRDHRWKTRLLGVEKRHYTLAAYSKSSCRWARPWRE